MRHDLQAQLDQLLTRVVAMSERADAMLGEALQALEVSDLEAARRVVVADDELDRAYEQVQQGVLAVVALHGPVAGDLRLLTALIHVSLHLERMGDYASGVARTVERVRDLPADEALTGQLLEMGTRAREVAHAAMQAFVHRDVEHARACARLDDDVDRLNLGIFHRLVRLASQDEHRLEWATHMIQLARLLERFADHGVDIAEQTVFVATGRTVELSASER
ncbi:phosphate signaling complex protein PhoU [Egicoccus sp. AB-alg6-2]|uniref:phosphate signaling complex protein PhoU n=1 Tax=Egicoccus sp. AB-alg6-2 TaxID=3242692 RepID=UPI00359D5B42